MMTLEQAEGMEVAVTGAVGTLEDVARRAAAQEAARADGALRSFGMSAVTRGHLLGALQDAVAEVERLAKELPE